jgi:ElaB/YqjD/DUF883 family membrane-anchored ribosome-binding protein
MGKKPDEIENEIRTYREAITRRMDDLQRRVQDDLQSVRQEAKDRASTAVGGTKDALKVDNLNDSMRSLMEEHALSSVAAALGVGVVLGMVSEGGSSDGAERSEGRPGYRYETNGSRRNGGRSGLTSMLASFVGPAASTAQNELQDLVREGFSLVKEQVEHVRSDLKSSERKSPAADESGMPYE